MSVETMLLLASLGVNLGTIGHVIRWSTRLESRLTRLETTMYWLLPADKRDSLLPEVGGRV